MPAEASGRRLVRALVLADGDAPDRAGLDAAWPGWDRGIDLVVGADAGALMAERLGLRLDLVVGDGDSAGEAELARLAAAGVAIDRSPVDKDETDTELAILAAVERGADELTILGALGGPRIDHELANVALLAHPALDGRRATLLDGRARVRLIVAPDGSGQPVRRAIPGPVGDTVSLLPLAGTVSGITTRGFRYPLHDEGLPLGPARGMSNVRSATDATLVVRRGRLLVVEVAPASLLRSHDEHA
jgi:thiamine pyrophosphokinase